MTIYQPAEDSYFFANFLEKYLPGKSLKILDMGTGSGILAKTASKFLNPKNILAVDINPEAVKKLEKEKFKTIQSDLFENIKEKFDLITFNAPYLPLDKREPKSSQTATTGGEKGDEISLKFLEKAKSYLNKNGKILILISSLTPMDRIKKFNPKVVARKRIFMEELLILEIVGK
jgi:release factor glutamine methyltransferase